MSAVVRAGDVQGALALAVTTEGISPDRGAVPGVALAALIEARMASHGNVTTVGGWGGWRLRALLASASSAAPLVDAIREAMLAPVATDDPALALVRRKVEALAQRPLPDRAMIDVARCTGEPFGLGGDAAPDAAELETWRRAALGAGRVAFATAGDEALAAAVTDALARGPAWPGAATIPPSNWPAVDAPPVVYDASSEIPAGGARVVVTARTSSPDRAVTSAPALGAVHGPLASRLAALDAPARLRSVVATAHGDGGCLAATIDIAARDLTADAPARIATAATLARQEMTVELADTSGALDQGGALAQRAADPRDAAEQAAWWALAGRRAEPADALRLAVSVGVAMARDAGPPAVAPAAIRSEIDRATIAWHAPVVEARTSLERGQGEAWILLASTCGTAGEAARDAGSGAAVAAAAAMQATTGAGDTHVEPFVAVDGIGILAHGPAHAGESPQAHVRRIADLAARAFAADALDPDRVDLARSSLLVRAGEIGRRVLGAAAGALTPGHPSWIVALGTSFGLASTSDDDVALRAAAMRSGPMRVAVLANADETQADGAVRAVDRWIARRPGEVRACPALPVVRPRAGTYAVDLPAGARSEALLAIPLLPGDDAARTAATWVAAVLDGADGLLAHALLSQGDAGRSLALASSASVLGLHDAALVVHVVVADDAALDGAVAQTRALLDRLRQGALRDEDRARAAALLSGAALTASLDPRERAVALWRGAHPQPEPSIDALRTFAAATLHDDALVIVAARPPRTEGAGHAAKRGAAR